MRAASIDIGTNTIRLLVADCQNNEGFKPIFRKELITRLGGGFASEGGISEAAMARTIDGLKDFQKIITKLRTDEVIAVATSVVRRALNKDTFIEKVRKEAGIEIHLISGVTEAMLAAKGALLPLQEAFDHALIFDIGGGSTEFIFTKGTRHITMESIDLGVVHLAEVFLLNDPPQKNELVALDKTIQAKIQPVKQRFRDYGLYPFKPDCRVILIGIAGTPTTLAAIDLKLVKYERTRVTNHTLNSGRIVEIFQQLTKKTAAERLLIAGLQKGREDLIIPGVLIVKGIMNTFGFSTLRVIDSGILEGIMLSIHHQER
ncbi:MAG: exopolyphosphatase [Proteobacteria bacterium]|nr:exopolyphosphatase [Pseudomonadota bacterium]